MKQRTLFAVDVGNTRVKIARWLRGFPNPIDPRARSSSPDAECADPTADLDETKRWLSDEAKCGDQSALWVVSSVSARKTVRLKELLASLRPQDACRLIELDDLPIKVDYDYPEKLGIDRAVAAYAGLRILPPKTPFLTIDVGTAATIDYVDQNGVFRGGAILPGPTLCAEALTRKTDALPMIDDPENASLDGRTRRGALEYPATETNNAIRLGVVFTLVGAITAFYWKTRLTLEREGGNPNALRLLIAGGDATSTERNLNNYFDDMAANFGGTVPRPSIVVEPRLALYGLAELANDEARLKRKGLTL
ncbi:MAG: type III pantothenate kinase [Thermoguttaceae bacterium]|nr:type III pantothenate kinase [Thermoguttaceae bacterium]